MTTSSSEYAGLGIMRSKDKNSGRYATRQWEVLPGKEGPDLCGFGRYTTARRTSNASKIKTLQKKESNASINLRIASFLGLKRVSEVGEFYMGRGFFG